MLHKFTIYKPILYSFLFSVLSSYTIYCVISQQFYIQLNANAISSFAYALIDTDVIMRVPLSILSIASFNLWTHNNKQISFIDVTSIFWTIIATTLYIIPNNRRLLSVVNIAFISFIIGAIATDKDTPILCYYADNLIVLNALIYTLCATIMASIYGINRNFLIGTSLSSLGYICKLLFIFMDQRWGTTVFHIITALGIQFLLKLYTTKEILSIQLNNISIS